jgi:outer membrane protein assembly factor BamB
MRHQDPNSRNFLPASRFTAKPPDHPPVIHRLLRRLRLLAMLAIAGILLAACDWPMFQYNLGRSGFNPTESAISVSNVSGLVQRFAAGTPDATGYFRAYSPPAVANGLVYVGSPNSGLYALDAATGALRWTALTPGTVSYSPAVANGVVYVSAGAGLWALDATNGALRWTAHTSDEPRSSPAVANGVVYVGTKVSLDALDAATGALRWTAPIGSRVSSPAVDNGVVYVSVDDGTLYAFDAATGSIRWVFPLGSSPSSPAVVNGVVYATSSDWLLAVDSATGLALWAAPYGGTQAPAVANGVVYVVGSGGRLYAFDATASANCSDLPGFPTWPFAPKSCEPLWRAPTLGVASSPAVANGVVYLSSTSLSPGYEIQSAAQAFDAAGNGNCSGTPKVCAPLWTDNIGDAWPPSSPAIANGVVYMPSDRLYAYALP